MRLYPNILADPERPDPALRGRTDAREKGED